MNNNSCINLKLILILALICFSFNTQANHYDVVVSKDGTGDCTTLTEALGKISKLNYQRAVIFVKNGVYEEKIRITQNFVTIVGESRDSTIIQYSILRSDWNKNKDYIGHAVINIHADDVILKNLTVINTQPEIGPHAFTIFGSGTRTIIANCNVLSKGGDTVSLWNYTHGMYYHTNCHFEGAVDFVCPRGWCYISNSTFYEHKKTATLWHAATINENQKFVLKNCSFDGVEGFELGRHHYEAQFYLIDCKFSKNMKDKAIYRVTYEDKSRNRPYFWGDRYYFHNCQNENYSWQKNNLNHVNPEEITPFWTFDNTWDPEDNQPPLCSSYEIKDTSIIFHFEETISVRGSLKIETYTGKKLSFVMGQGRKMLLFSGEMMLNELDFKNDVSITEGEIVATIATINERKLTDRLSICED